MKIVLVSFQKTISHGNKLDGIRSLLTDKEFRLRNNTVTTETFFL